MDIGVVVTGGAGFIGSNLILYLNEHHPEFRILNIDKLTYASNLEHLDPVKHTGRYDFERVDLVERDAVREIIQDWRPEGVFHLAAESHVDNSIRGPEPFVLSNVIGTFNLIEECRQLWFNEQDSFRRHRFLHVSTDEVYGTLGRTGSFREISPYAPNSPYAATKAGSDMIVRSYHHTYGVNTAITNSSNNYGRHQHDEKLIPTVIRRALEHGSIPVYGKGENVRDWLHVEDHCKALATVFKEGRPGESHCIGGENEWSNIDLVRRICDILNREAGGGPDGDYKNLIRFVRDRPGHDYRYAVDTTKIRAEFNWAPSKNCDELLTQTVLWYVDKYKG
ncbi:MAG: dTDP-glucose 4,6-dehydratase [Gemmatimonadales bacterium]|nr:MAG: dTDP-glucose 4,6-dehydratase [Gemmatimonadales bacterium]